MGTFTLKPYIIPRNKAVKTVVVDNINTLQTYIRGRFLFLTDIRQQSSAIEQTTLMDEL